MDFRAQRRSVRLKISCALAFGFVALSCSPSSNRISSPRLRGAASSTQPCPNSAKAKEQQAESNPSALSLPMPSISEISIRKAGGFLLTEGFGVEAGLESHKSIVTFSDGREKLTGNPKGMIDVLNIPACTEARPSMDAVTLKRCISRASWEDLSLSENRSQRDKLLSEPWAPRRVFKKCTASLTVDGHDFGDALSSGRLSGLQRLRVWTAEHCYQSSYARNVHLFLPSHEVVDEKLGVKGYVSLPLHKVDGIEFSRAVLAKGSGGGRAGDPDLTKKMFILRSMDGRSAETYQAAVRDGCLLKERPVSAESPFAKSKFVDCFTTADLATFKASVDLDDLSRSSFKEPLSQQTLAEARRQLVLDVLKKEKNRYNALQNANTSPVVQDLLKFLKVGADLFGFGELLISQLDGLGHARRFEAMLREQSEFSINSLSDLGDFESDFRTYKFDASELNFLERQFDELTRSFVPGADDLTCGLLRRCPSFVMSPLHTVELEARFYQPIKDLKTFGKMMLGKTLLTAINPNMDEAHPLKLRPTDSEAQTSTKLGAIYTRITFETVLLRTEPFEEVPFYNQVSKAFQQALKLVCPSPEFANQIVPVFLNRASVRNPLMFRQFGLLGPGLLKIMPIVGADAATGVGFSAGMCGNKASVVANLGDLETRTGGAQIPRESVVAIDADDALLCLPVRSVDNKFVANPACSEEQRLEAPFTYLGKRNVYRFEGATLNAANVVGPSDSGTLWTFLGIPAFALTSHNGELVNGVVFDDMPDINTIDPDRGAVAAGPQGGPNETCQ